MKTDSSTDCESTSAITPESTGPSRRFAATHWSVVLAAAHSDTTRAGAALETLCQNYWHPLYAYVRRRGFSPEDAQDLTQDFFARLIDREAMGTVTRAKGRFRSFLLASMNHFLADEWDKSRAQKRGGGKGMTLNLQDAETWFGEIPAEDLTPERAFDRRWAITLLEQVYVRLANEHEREGKSKLFAILRPTLAGRSESAPYLELAQQLGLSEGAVKTAVHRLRQRYRELLRQTIAETVSSPDEVEDELRYLFQILAG